MNQKTTQTTALWMLVGVILGAICGYLIPVRWVAPLEFIGILFVNALQVLVFPLILTTIIVGLSSLADVRKLGRIGLKTLGYIGATSGIAVVLGLASAFIFRPGVGVRLLDTARSFDPVSPLQGFTDFIAGMIPTSIPAALVDSNFLALIVVSILFAAALSTVATKAKSVISFFKGFQTVLMKMVDWILVVAPFGLFVLVAHGIASHRHDMGDMIVGVALVSLAVFAGLLLQAIVVLPLALRMLGQQSPMTYFGNLIPALLTGFGSASSVATLPVTYENVVEKSEVDSRAGSLVLPVAAVLNSNGSALFLAVAGVFIAQATGMLSVLTIVKIALGALIVSLGVAGQPSGALWGVVAVGTIAGFPREAFAAVGLLVIVDWLLDRLRTLVNVQGDAVAAAVIAETFEFKTVGRRAITTRSRTITDRSKPARGRTSSTSARGERPSTRRGGARTGPKTTRRTTGNDSPAVSHSKAPVRDTAPTVPPKASEERRSDAPRSSARPSRPSRSRSKQDPRRSRPDSRPPKPESKRPVEPPKSAEPQKPAEQLRPVDVSAETKAAAAALSREKIERELSQVQMQLSSNTSTPNETASQSKDREVTDSTSPARETDRSASSESSGRPRRTGRSRGRTERPSGSSRPASERPAEPVRPEPTRERKEVADETPPSPPPERRLERVSTPEPSKPAESSRPERSEAADKPESKPASGSDEPTDAPSPSFGRSRARKHAPKSGAKGKDSAKEPRPGPVDKDQSGAEVLDVSAAKDISFGRSKRKRTR